MRCDAITCYQIQFLASMFLGLPFPSQDFSFFLESLVRDRQATAISTFKKWIWMSGAFSRQPASQGGPRKNQWISYRFDKTQNNQTLEPIFNSNSYLLPLASCQISSARSHQTEALKTKPNAEANIRELHRQLAYRRGYEMCDVIFVSGFLPTCFAKILMLFVCGITSKRDQDAFWKKRLVEDGRSPASKHFNTACQRDCQHRSMTLNRMAPQHVDFSWYCDNYDSMARMEAGIFVAWNWQMIIVLVVTLLQNWLAGRSRERHFLSCSRVFEFTSTASWYWEEVDRMVETVEGLYNL